MSKSKAEQAQATQHALLRVGRRLFARRGFDAVSAEEIVAAANVTRGALYHHFDGKDGLFRAVVVDVMREVCKRLENDSAGARSALDAVERGVRSFLDACSEPAYQRILLIDGPAVLGWHEWRTLDLEHGLGLLRRGLEAAVRTKEIAVADVEMTTHLLAGALIDGALLVGKDRADRATRTRVEATLMQLLRSLSRDP
jgi:AcrR family transcriptional regulator